METVKLPRDRGRRMVAGMSRRAPVLALVALAFAGGAAVATARVLAWPEDAGQLAPDPAAGRRFQGVLAQLLLRESGLSSRQDPLDLTAADVNAFLEHHVEVKGPPVWPIRVRLEAGQLELGGATTLGKLLQRGSGSGERWPVLGSLGDYPIWVAVAGTVTVQGSRGEFSAQSARIGRQGVPVSVLWRLVGGRPQALTWRMPKVVERVDVEPGRLLIHTRRARSGGGLRRLGSGARALRATPAALAQPHEPHPEGGQHLLQHGALVRRPVAPGLFLEHGQEVDSEPRLLQVDVWTPAHRVRSLPHVGHGVPVDHDQQRGQVSLRHAPWPPCRPAGHSGRRREGRLGGMGWRRRPRARRVDDRGWGWSGRGLVVTPPSAVDHVEAGIGLALGHRCILLGGTGLGSEPAEAL